MADGNLKVLYYCHDTYGLGHITRSVTLAGQLAEQWPGSSQLIVTGSPLAHEVTLPVRTDIVKLPSVIKIGTRQYAARTLGTDFATIKSIRSELLLTAALAFRPDVAIVDHAPAGMMGDAVPALRALKAKSPGTRLVLGLRDIVDSPERTVAEWTAVGAQELMETVYDRILVYGTRDVCDVGRTYGMSPSIQAKIRYVGYLGRASQTAAPRRRVPLVLVTVGGGGDGYELMRRYLDDLHAAYPEGDVPFRSLLVTGPFMAATEFRDLRDMARSSGVGLSTSVKAYVPALATAIAHADAIVAMAGYNTTCEILTYGRPAILVPRVRPRQEQLIRARALARRGLVRMLHPDEIEPGQLLDQVRRTLASPVRPHRPVDLNGLPNAAHELELLLHQSRRRAAVTSAVGS